MLKICPICKKEFELNNSKYCSKECYKEHRKEYRRKWEKNPKRKEYKKEWDNKNRDKVHLYYKKYYDNGGKETKIEYHKNNKDKFRDYQKEWEKENIVSRREYRREYYKDNINKEREKQRRFKKTDKGILSMIKTSERRRKKNLIRASKKWDEPTFEIIKLLKNRDKECVYCNSQFNYPNRHNPKYPTYDHLNANLPLSNINAVRCCLSCNSSKKDKDVLIWLKEKGLKPKPLILELLKKQNEKNTLS